MSFQERLIFLIGSPRSGTTLLQRMLGSHSRIHTLPEPHLMTPLAHLGYYATVDKAPYDHINAAEANRELVTHLPRQEEDYLDACRAYADTIYERLLEPTGKERFLDKTPAYGLILDFLQKVYPDAGYVVLTRHPVAILHSFAHSFFDGDYRKAWEFNPIPARYVPAMARFLREKPVSMVHLRYEDLVAEPEVGLGRICEHLGLPMEAAAVEYGSHSHVKGSFGDPITVNAHQRPVKDKAQRWASDLAADAEAREFVQQVMETLDPADLELWGYPKDELFAPLADAGAAPTKLSPFNGYRLRRKLMLGLKTPVQQDSLGLGRAVRRVRYYCDVLLRE
ncbi:MAG: sulfotransferase [Deltaproteobacteria bacterium]|nr:sulfotransferase [Deltaproteobacteria bacterium]